MGSGAATSFFLYHSGAVTTSSLYQIIMSASYIKLVIYFNEVLLFGLCFMCLDFTVYILYSNKLGSLYILTCFKLYDCGAPKVGKSQRFWLLLHSHWPGLPAVLFVLHILYDYLVY